MKKSAWKTYKAEVGYEWTTHRTGETKHSVTSINLQARNDDEARRIAKKEWAQSHLGEITGIVLWELK